MNIIIVVTSKKWLRLVSQELIAYAYTYFHSDLHIWTCSHTHTHAHTHTHTHTHTACKVWVSDFSVHCSSHRSTSFLWRRVHTGKCDHWYFISLWNWCNAVLGLFLVLAVLVCWDGTFGAVCAYDWEYRVGVHYAEETPDHLPITQHWHQLRQLFLCQLQQTLPVHAIRPNGFKSCFSDLFLVASWQELTEVSYGEIFHVNTGGHGQRRLSLFTLLELSLRFSLFSHFDYVPRRILIISGMYQLLGTRYPY